MTPKARLVEILKQRSVRWPIRLGKWKRKRLYVDGRQTTLDPEGSWLISELILDCLSDEVEGVGGLTMVRTLWHALSLRYPGRKADRYRLSHSKTAERTWTQEVR